VTGVGRLVEQDLVLEDGEYRYCRERSLLEEEEEADEEKEEEQKEEEAAEEEAEEPCRRGFCLRDSRLTSFSLRRTSIVDISPFQCIS
jgi:hypothetical protein